MTSVYWSLAQAITWISTRDDEAVAEAPQAVVLLELLELFDQDIGLDAARRELWHKLQLGELIATGKTHNNERITIPPERWQDLVATLHGKTELLQLKGVEPGSYFTAVTLTTTAVRKIWPAIPKSVPGKRGPKPKVDPIEFEREVHRYIVENGIPDPKLDPRERQADLEKHMMRWHGDKLGTSRNRDLVVAAIRSFTAGNSAN